MEEKYIVSIEIGSSKIRGALGQFDKAGILNVMAVQEEPMLDSVRYGQVRNVEEVANTIDEICRKLENAKSIMGRQIEKVYIGLSGRSIMGVKAETTITFGSENEITMQIVEELMDRIVAERESDKEIYEIVPVSYSVDNEVTVKPIGRVGKSIKGVFEIVEGNAVIKSNLNRAVIDRLGLEVADYVVSILAEADAVLSPEDKQLGCMLVDFGAETTTTAIYRGGALQYLSTLPMGSRNITHDLMSLNYLEEQAEQIKRSVGVINPSDQTPQIANSHLAENPEIGNYIQSRASEIAANIYAQIEFAGFKVADLPAGFILVGGGARLKGFSDRLADQKMRVRMGTIPGNVRISDASIHAGEAIDVISLLLWAMKQPDVENCVSVPEAQQPKQQAAMPHHDSNPEESRIGRQWDEVSLDDDDSEDDGYSMHDHFGEENKPATKKEKKPKKEKGSEEGWYKKMIDRLKKLAEDDLKDDYEDDGRR